jgi:hypothetical protein
MKHNDGITSKQMWTVALLAMALCGIVAAMLK